MWVDVIKCQQTGKRVKFFYRCKEEARHSCTKNSMIKKVKRFRITNLYILYRTCNYNACWIDIVVRDLLSKAKFGSSADFYSLQPMFSITLRNVQSAVFAKIPSYLTYKKVITVKSNKYLKLDALPRTETSQLWFVSTFSSCALTIRKRSNKD